MFRAYWRKIDVGDDEITGCHNIEYYKMIYRYYNDYSILNILNTKYRKHREPSEPSQNFRPKARPKFSRALYMVKT